MRFAVSSATGQIGKVTVRVPTPEAALSLAKYLKRGGSAAVIITITATGVRFSEEQFEAALRDGKMKLENARDADSSSRMIDPKFQAH